MKIPASQLKTGQTIMLKFDGMKEEPLRITRISPDPVHKNWVRIEFDCAMSCRLPATQMVRTKVKLTIGGKSV